MDEHAPRPKRLSLSEILELVLTRQHADRSAVTLARTASGETTIEVKVAAGNGTEAETVGDAASVAQDLYESLRAVYPASERRDPATVSLSRNAKGETQIEVSIRSGDGAAVTTDDLYTAAKAAYDKARSAYPMNDGRTAAPGSVA